MFYYGTDERSAPRLLCARAITDRYWSAAKCRSEGIDLPDEPTLTDWPTCVPCSGGWVHILTSQGHTPEARSFWWTNLWEEDHGLRPVGETAATLRARDEALIGKPMFPQLRSNRHDRVGESQIARPAGVTDVALEAQLTASFVVEARNPTTVSRKEAKLVRRYVDSIERVGSTATRKRIDVGGPAPLYADLFDHAREELIEAKSSSSRDDVRLALGQLLDYRRYVKPRSMAVLLPADPGADMIELLHSHGITCVVEVVPGVFNRIDPPEPAISNRDDVAAPRLD
jgi:hypothetical protein